MMQGIDKFLESIFQAYKIPSVEGDNVQIVGTWDVGAMIGTEITLVVAKADIESYQ